MTFSFNFYMCELKKLINFLFLTDLSPVVLTTHQPLQELPNSTFIQICTTSLFSCNYMNIIIWYSLILLSPLDIWRVSSQNALYPFWSIWDIWDLSCWNIKTIIRNFLNTFDHNFKNIPLYIMSNVSLERYYFVLYDGALI